jgi:glycosyltransferase involved in cell wall biosynthesis
VTRDFGSPLAIARPAQARVPVTVVLPVLNEERNLPAALESVAFADEVVVVDSASTDRTAAIAEEHGARVEQFSYNGLGPRKKAWALEHLELANDWVLMLDADERVPAALRDEIAAAIESGEADGYFVDREFVFMGRSLRCFRPNWNLRLFRTGCGCMEDLGLYELPRTGDNEVHEHIVVEGPTAFLKTALLHQDYRGLTDWLDRHNRYATWEAHLYRKFRTEPLGVGPAGFLRLDPVRRKRVLRRLWSRLPARPLLRFFVWYLVRRGFLDRRPGFAFCVLMSYYEFIIKAKMRELEQGEAAARPT